MTNVGKTIEALIRDANLRAMDLTGPWGTGKPDCPPHFPSRWARPPCGAWGTHSLRKTFARRIFEACGHDLILTRTAMGHAQVSTTERYRAADLEQAAALIRNLANRAAAMADARIA